MLPIPVQAEGPEGLYSLSACLMDGNSGRLLYGKEALRPMPMASTTKIMTCILALETMALDTQIIISKKAAAMPKVHLGAPAGTKFILQDLLYSLMLESHNDSAVAIAEQASGGVKEFAALMNKKAAEIGCEDTYFVTPNGLDGEDAGGIHHTTAADLAKILYYCISQSDKKELFLKITQAPSYTVQALEGRFSYQCSNHNAFLNMMDGALTGKTGFTNKAGYCYVGALKRGERTFIVALLASGWPNHKNYKWLDTRKLMNYALEHYAYREVFDEAPQLEKITVTDGIGGVCLGKRSIPVKLYLDAPQDASLRGAAKGR